MNKVIFSHLSDHWATPRWLYSMFILNDFIDPCPLHCDSDNLGKKFFKEKIFINPPYSNISQWVDYAIDLCVTGNVVYLLIPCRTDTRYFYKLSSFIDTIYFIKGRLKFSESRSAPFPSCLIKLVVFSDFFQPADSVAKFVSKEELTKFLENC